MIDLKQSKKRTADKPVDVLNESSYPYGTRLSFQEEEIKKIKALQTIEFEETVLIKAVGKVVSLVSNSVRNGKENKEERRVEIQIEKIEISDSKDFDAGFKGDKKDQE